MHNFTALPYKGPALTSVQPTLYVMRHDLLNVQDRMFAQNLHAAYVSGALIHVRQLKSLTRCR